MNIETGDIENILSGTGTGRQAVIPILQAIQSKYRFLPEEALRKVSDLTGITAGRLIGVASFYSQFRLEPTGSHLVRVCTGTACHVKGAPLVHDAVLRELGIGEGSDTDASRKYTVEKVNCMGCCTLAPVVRIDDTTYGHVASDKVRNILNDFESRKADRSRTGPNHRQPGIVTAPGLI